MSAVQKTMYSSEQHSFINIIQLSVSKKELNATKAAKNLSKCYYMNSKNNVHDSRIHYILGGGAEHK